MTKKQYIKAVRTFYLDRKDKLYNDYVEHKIEEKLGIPFEMFVLTICDDECADEVYEWFGQNYTRLKSDYDSWIKNEIFELFPNSDFFNYMLKSYMFNQN
jgi:hypothetical protein